MRDDTPFIFKSTASLIQVFLLSVLVDLKSRLTIKSLYTAYSWEQKNLFDKELVSDMYG